MEHEILKSDPEVRGCYIPPPAKRWTWTIKFRVSSVAKAHALIQGLETIPSQSAHTLPPLLITLYHSHDIARTLQSVTK